MSTPEEDGGLSEGTKKELKKMLPMLKVVVEQARTTWGFKNNEIVDFFRAFNMDALNKFIASKFGSGSSSS